MLKFPKFFGSFRKSRGITISETLVACGGQTPGNYISEIFGRLARGHKVSDFFGTGSRS